MDKFTSELIEKLDGVVKAVGAHLGLKFDEEWASKRETGWNYHAYLTNGHTSLSLQYGDYKNPNRWVISGDFPRYKGEYMKPYGENFQIAVSGEKPAEKIAKDIKSRLLPDYLGALAKAEECLEKTTKYHAGKLEAIRKVARFLEVPEPEEGKEVIYLSFDKELLGSHVYKIESYDESSVKFDVETSPEKAIRILQILMEN